MKVILYRNTTDRSKSYKQWRFGTEKLGSSVAHATGLSEST
jgi:hypothetical protein